MTGGDAIWFGTVSLQQVKGDNRNHRRRQRSDQQPHRMDGAVVETLSKDRKASRIWGIGDNREARR
jgi:hypothetical protein